MKFDVGEIRKLFPSLSQQTDEGRLPVFLDNPGGTQVPQPVIDAVGEYYRRMNANSGGAFATSRRSDAAVEAARERMADFLNAQCPEEIVFGANMTTLNFALSRALAKTLRTGDEIVVTRMDHDGNIAPWLRIAEDHRLKVRWVDMRPDDCTLDMDSLAAALSDRTRIVAIVHASNAVGTINPVREVAEMAHAAGALVVTDAVQSAPHVPIDVRSMGCDFLLCSAYKFFGPHVGIMWGRYELLAELPAYKVRPAADIPPFRWETGTLSFETINGVSAAIDYLASIGEQFGAGDFADVDGRRLVLKRSMAAIQAYEHGLTRHLIEGLQSLPGVSMAGITEPERSCERVPVVSFVVAGHTPRAVAEYLGARDIYVWDGDYYAPEVMRRLGRGEQGMVRVGLVHYNTAAEVDRFIGALEGLCAEGG